MDGNVAGSIDLRTLVLAVLGMTIVIRAGFRLIILLLYRASIRDLLARTTELRANGIVLRTSPPTRKTPGGENPKTAGVESTARPQDWGDAERLRQRFDLEEE